jgi:hypothetical protein
VVAWLRATCTLPASGRFTDPDAAGSGHLPAKAWALCQQMNRRPVPEQPKKNTWTLQ